MRAQKKAQPSAAVKLPASAGQSILVKEFIQGIVLGFLIGVLVAYLMLG